MKIVHEKNKCLGCGICAEVCPEVFSMDSNGKAFLRGDNVNVKEDKDKGTASVVVKGLSCPSRAAALCPVQCIHILDSND